MQPVVVRPTRRTCERGRSASGGSGGSRTIEHACAVFVYLVEWRSWWRVVVTRCAVPSRHGRGKGVGTAGDVAAG